MSFEEYKKTERRYRAFFTRARTACEIQESDAAESATTESALTKRAFILIPAPYNLII